VTKVNVVQDEEVGLEEVDEDSDQEAAESEDSQSPKKKIESPFQQQRPEPTVGEDGQVDLFREESKPKQQLPQRRAATPKAFGAKIKAEQQSLFGEKSREQQQSGQDQKNESENEGEVKRGDKDLASGKESRNSLKKDDKSFNVGETIEFEL
jgi:hypothetical protein